MMYSWNDEIYRVIRQNPDKVAWKDFASEKARRDFNDYFCIANPYLIKGRPEHLFWKNYFDNYFNCNCTFPFIVRLINSFMIAAA